MSQININNLTFRYDNYGENIFNDISFVLDTDWKLGLIGRNGRGKTTLLKLIMGELVGRGSIISSVNFQYFPMEINNKNRDTMEVIKEAIAPFKMWENLMDEYSKDERFINEYGEILEKYIDNDGYIIEELIKKEIGLLKMDNQILERSFDSLSGGEQTKILLIALFLRKNNFLLIDEPTNHLDIYGREMVAEYLSSKKGFILVSHDREFLDKIVDHIISINKKNIEVQKGNYSTWQLNKDRQDNFELSRNNILKKDINKLKNSALEKSKWSNKVESSKFGNGPSDRGYIGAKSAKMMKSSKNIEKRQNKAIEEKSNLLKNLEEEEDLKLNIGTSHKMQILNIKDLSISYGDRCLFQPLSFQIMQGQCVSLMGDNGSGKSSILKLLMGEDISYTGIVEKPKSISYVSQDTSYLKGKLEEYIVKNNINQTILKGNLKKLGLERSMFEKNIEDWSQGQKKKLLIGKSLCDEAQLYIWDEPLNFIDIITRTQIEKLIKSVKPTMLIVEHDGSFIKNINSSIVKIIR